MTDVILAPQLIVGYALQTREEIDSLPPGTVIGPDGGDTYTKRTDGGWTYNPFGSRFSPGGFSLNRHNRIISLPAPPCRLSVGDSLNSQADFDDLPIGSVIGPNAREQYIKHIDGGWYDCDADHVMTGSGPRTSLNRTGFNAVRLVGAGPPVVVQPMVFGVGDMVTSRAMFDALPVGATISENGGTVFTCDGPGQFTYPRGRAHSYTSGDFSINWMEILSLPGVTPKSQSLAQLKWAYRQAVQQGIETNLSSRGGERVRQAFRTLGITGNDLPLGVGAKIKCNLDRDRLPVGSLAYVGNPTNWAGYALYTKTDGGWNKVMGGSNRTTEGGIITVSRVGEEETHQAWIDNPPGPDEGNLVNAWKARAYREGLEVKAAHQWCGTFDQIVARVGITDACLRYEITVNGIAVGQHVQPHQAVQCPIGTIFRWINPRSEHTQTWYMRTESSDNPAGTTRLFTFGGTSGRFHYHDQMEVLAFPREEGMSIPPDGEWLNMFDALPVGTTWSTGGSSYVMLGDHRASPFSSVRPEVRANLERLAGLTGQYNARAFGDNPTDLRFVSFPVPT